MHTVVIHAKFRFGDRVRFDSQFLGISGTGKIFAITIDRDSQISYLIDTTPTGEYVETLAQGLLEREINLLD